MLKQLKKKLTRRQASQTTFEAPAAGSISEEPEVAERFGLFSLTDKSPPSGSDQYPVDITAIHGLNGGAISTWTHSNGTMWIRDLLPAFLPGSRAFTYGYPSKIFSSSFSRVQEYARNLLSSLRDVREDSRTNRPIIFICHSLGGLVCKQALVLAHEDEVSYGVVLKSVIGVVFLGTPHRGSDLANQGYIGGTVANILKTTVSAGLRPGTVRTDLLSYLQNDSQPLQDLLESSRHRLQNLAVVSFYETEATPPLSCLIVDRTSSILGPDFSTSSTD